MPMLPRVVLSGGFGEPYNADFRYNQAGVSYNQGGSLGAATGRTVPTAAAAPRSVATASMKGR